MTQLNDLKPNPQNPRSITETKLASLKKALLKFGDLGGFVFNVKSEQLVGGHQRAKLFPKGEIVLTRKYASPTKTGTTAEGFVRIGGERHKYREVAWDKNTERAANIAANKGGGEWNEEVLGEWMKELSKGSFDLDTTLFDKQEREPFLAEAKTKSVAFEAKDGAGEDEIPSLPKKSKTKLGDLIQLGPHRLLCGDTLKSGDVKRLVGAFGVDLVFTDPPYDQLQTKAGFSDSRPGWAAHKTDDLNGFDPQKLFPIVEQLKAETAYFFCNKSLLVRYLTWAQERGPWNLLVMGKNNPIPSKANKFLSDIEWLVFSRKKKAYFNSDLEYDFYRQVRMVSVKGAEHGHPTEKQVGFIEPYIQLSAPNGGVVVDLFGGSGTTMIACEKLSRRCLMMELNPIYCDVIVSRWEKFTGKKAKRS